MGFVSFRPSEFVQGGLIDDINGKITDAKFIAYDYNGKADVTVPALGIEITLEDGTKHESFYSAGDMKNFVPSEDGKQLVPVSDKSHITNSCKLAIFITELVNAGFPENLLDEMTTNLVGLTAHFQRKADKERKGLVKKEGQRGGDSTLVVTKIIAMPGEKAPAAPKAPAAGQPTTAAKAAPTSAAAPAAANGEAPTDETISTVLTLLGENGGSISKAKISQLVFKHIGKGHEYEAKRNAIVQLAFKDDFLKAGADNGMWAFDGTTISLAQ